MPWWRRVSNARLLVVACVDDQRSNARNAYLEAFRRIGRGNLGPFDHAGRHVTTFAISAEHFLDPPVAEWGDRMPDNLPDLVRRTSDGQMQTIEFKGSDRFGHVRLHAPYFPQQLLVSSAALRNGWSLHEPWNSLFPGIGALDFWTLKQELLELRRLPSEGRRLNAATKCRELAQTLLCSTQLPLWDLRAAEDQEEVLADAAEQFDIHMRTWPELRQSQEFQERVCKPMSVIVTKGWAGVIWLQMHLALLETRFCQFAGCDTGLEVSQRMYCAAHREEAERLAARDRQRRRRRALR